MCLSWRVLSKCAICMKNIEMFTIEFTFCMKTVGMLSAKGETAC